LEKAIKEMIDLINKWFVKKMKSLKSKLEYHYKKFDYSQVYPDPLIFPHRFKNELDIEISAFVSSIFP
jgi:isoleucyl-tRNA synthetase